MWFLRRTSQALRYYDQQQTQNGKGGLIFDLSTSPNLTRQSESFSHAPVCVYNGIKHTGQFIMLIKCEPGSFQLHYLDKDNRPEKCHSFQSIYFPST